MNFTPTLASFFFILCFSIFFCVSSSNWFGVWMGLELNMISFIVLMMSANSINSSEASIKYFLLQALGSGLFFMGFIFSYMESSSWGIFLEVKNSSMLILLGLCIKLGAAPLHYWVPSVMNGISTENALILSTFQKIGPLMFFLYLYSFSLSAVVILICILSVFFGGWGGLNQTQLRALLAYSSISHLGWMIAASMISLLYSLFYFSIYILSVALVFICMALIEINEMKNLPSKSSLDINKMMFYLSLLSLGGLPPLLGFFPKMIVFNGLVSWNFFMFALLLIFGSLMSLFYYLNLFFTNYIKASIILKQNNYVLFEKNKMGLSLVMMLIGLSGLFMLELILI